MQAFKKVGVIIALSALSLSSAWAAGEFTAEAELDGFQVVPPVLTAKQTEAGEPLCLTFPEPPPTPAATGEVLALIALPNPWKMKLTTAIQEVRVPTDNIRLYFGQPFANGRPIATLCDNKATPGPRCAPEDDPAPGEQIDFGGNFELNDILFEGQQIRAPDAQLTIAEKIILEIDPEIPNPDILKRGNTFRLQNTEDAHALIKLLIERGLIYAVVNSKFEARVKGDEIIGYKPRRGVIDGDGEIRGTLGLRDTPCPP